MSETARETARNRDRERERETERERDRDRDRDRDRERERDRETESKQKILLRTFQDLKIPESKKKNVLSWIVPKSRPPPPNPQHPKDHYE